MLYTACVGAKESDLQGHPSKLESSSRSRPQNKSMSMFIAELMDEFLRRRKTGLKCSTALLGTLARDVIKRMKGESIPTVHCFISNHNVVVHSQTGKLIFSPRKELYIQKTFAFHLGGLFHGFSSGELDENLFREYG